MFKSPEIPQHSEEKKPSTVFDFSIQENPPVPFLPSSMKVCINLSFFAEVQLFMTHSCKYEDCRQQIGNVSFIKKYFSAAKYMNNKRMIYKTLSLLVQTKATAHAEVSPCQMPN